jgi:Fe-coproporphyrin III synthase
LDAAEEHMHYTSPTGVAPVLQLHPSRHCNLACAHCYSLSGPTIREELPWHLLSNCLEDAVSLGYRQLAVSGGEPLLYAKLCDLLSKARSLGMITTLTSNGMLITPARWGPLAALVDLIAISIDGTEPEHDRVRGQKGAFARTVANFEVFRSSGVPFGIIFTLTQQNVDSLEFVVRLAAEQGARSVQVHPLTLYGRAATALPDGRPDGLELSVALFEATRLGDQLGISVHVDALTVQQLVAYRSHFVPERPIRKLVDIAPVLVVEADATVMPMTHEVSRTLKLGSLANARLSLLARDWLADGHGDRLADACERTWFDLTVAGQNLNTAVYWYDEVSSRTQEPLPLPVLRGSVRPNTTHPLADDHRASA